MSGSARGRFRDQLLHARPRVRFVTIADDTYFPGLVALVSSLRLQGHAEPVSVLDLGLTDAQRAELGGHCEFVAPPPGALVLRLHGARAALPVPFRARRAVRRG